jgi:hypothetical protein
MDKLTTSIGYWTDEGKEFAWIRHILPQFESTRNALGDLLARALALTRKQAITSSSQEEVLFSLWLIRYSAHVLAGYYLYVQSLLSSPRSWKDRFFGRQLSSDEQLLREVIDSYLDLRIDFALLELRIQGKLPAWEGILLVKERITEHQE